MKKMIAWVLLVTLLLGTFAGCGSTQQTNEPTVAGGDIEGINAAIDYLKAFYKDGGSQTGADFERFGIVRIGGVPYEVVWTADTADVKAVVNDDGTVTIDVNEKCEKETTYKLTATVSDDAGNTASHSWEYILPASLGDDYTKIVDMAYALEKDAAMDYATTLVGTVTSINTAWSDEYKNITVTIIVEGREDKPIMCYRLKGDDAQDLAAGDLITVTGVLKNYNGTIEFDAGCTLDKVEKGAGKLGDIPSDPAEIVNAAYALEEGAALPYTATLTGMITSVDTPYSAEYKNITVSMAVEGCEDKPIQCYRLKGAGAETLMPGDEITVSGTLKNYKGKIEFDAGCQLLKLVKGENSVEIPTDPQEILKAAFALDYGEYLPYPVTLTGTIIGTDGYSQKYGNITVAITTEYGYFIKCFRMKGEGIDEIWLGDEITVSGNVTNYSGTIEFDAGCTLVSWVDKPDPKAPSDPKEILEEAFALSNYSSLPYYCTLTGVVDSFDKEWSVERGYVSLYMIVEGKTIEAYRLRGEGVEAIKKGDTITVWGMLKNFRGTIEFDSGCKLVSKKNQIVEDLYELESGETMDGEQTLTGKVTAIAPNIEFKASGKTIVCPGLKGYGTDMLEVGDTVTVRGTLTNNNDTYQFKSGATLVSWKNANLPKIDTSSTDAEIIEAAKLLGTADRLGEVIVGGMVTKVQSPYDEKYGNITVYMDVEGTSVKCYRLGGKKASVIGVGDQIWVSGMMINYQGAAQFTQGCKIVECILTDKTNVPTEPEETQPPVEEPADGSTLSLAQAIELAKKMDHDGYTNGKYYVSGTITNIKSTYYGEMDITDGVNTFHIYNTKSDFAALDPQPVVGDKVIIYGAIGRHYETYQIKYGSITSHTVADSGSGEDGEEPETPSLSTPSEIVEAAYSLASGQTLAGGPYTLTGTVQITEAYDESYGTLTLNLTVAGKVIQCKYVGGDKAATVADDDTITVKGNLQNYNGTVQIFKGTIVG